MNLNMFSIQAQELDFRRYGLLIDDPGDAGILRSGGNAENAGNPRPTIGGMLLET